MLFYIQNPILTFQLSKNMLFYIQNPILIFLFKIFLKWSGYLENRIILRRVEVELYCMVVLVSLTNTKYSETPNNRTKFKNIGQHDV